MSRGGGAAEYRAQKHFFFPLAFSQSVATPKPDELLRDLTPLEFRELAKSCAHEEGDQGDFDSVLDELGAPRSPGQALPPAPLCGIQSATTTDGLAGLQLLALAPELPTEPAARVLTEGRAEEDTTPSRPRARALTRRALPAAAKQGRTSSDAPSGLRVRIRPRAPPATAAKPARESGGSAASHDDPRGTGPPAGPPAGTDVSDEDQWACDVLQGQIEAMERYRDELRDEMETRRTKTALVLRQIVEAREALLRRQAERASAEAGTEGGGAGEVL